jgi:hypothetical protein
MTLANVADDIVRHYAPTPEMLQERLIDVTAISFHATVAR